MEDALEIPSADSDSWYGAEGMFNDKPSLLRFRPNLKEYLGHPLYARRLVITWNYQKRNSSGMPTATQSDEMRTFEDAIVSALDPDRLAIFAFAFTNDGIREWHFYVKDINEVGERINVALADFSKLPINLEVQDDPDWDELRSVYIQCK